MDIVGILVGGGIALLLVGGIGHSFWISLANLRHVRRMRQEWHTHLTQDQRLFEPTFARYYGKGPRIYDREINPADGTLGLTDEAVIFHGRNPSDVLVIPFTALRWIGTHTISIKPQSNTTAEDALIIHYEEPDFLAGQTQWRVVAFIASKQLNLLRDLGELSGLPVERLGNARPGAGPVDASRMIQNIHGQWSEKQPGLLYFAPDRVLFDFRDPILFSQVEHIDVYDEKGGLLNELVLMSESLLALKLRGETIDDYHVVGFQTREAERLGQWLHDVTGLPFEVHAKQKRKAE